MEAASEGESNKNMNHSPSGGPKKPKRQMKTPFQLEVLEKTYASMLFFSSLYLFLLPIFSASSYFV